MAVAAGERSYINPSKVQLRCASSVVQPGVIYRREHIAAIGSSVASHTMLYHFRRLLIFPACGKACAKFKAAEQPPESASEKERKRLQKCVFFL